MEMYCGKIISVVIVFFLKNVCLPVHVSYVLTKNRSRQIIVGVSKIVCHEACTLFSFFRVRLPILQIF